MEDRSVAIEIRLLSLLLFVFLVIDRDGPVRYRFVFALNMSHLR